MIIKLWILGAKKAYQWLNLNSYFLHPNIFLNLISLPSVSVSGEVADAWNAFRNGWSTAVPGESKNSAEGAPDNKVHEKMKNKPLFVMIQRSYFKCEIN